jgi:hypothetical protein
MVVMLVLLTAFVSGCSWFMTPEEREARRTMEGLVSLTEPVPPEDPNATHWFDNVGELTAEPVWQREVINPVSIVADISEIDIPNPDEWYGFVMNFWPIYLSEENGDLVLRGVHCTRHSQLLGLGSYVVIDGLQRWVIGSDNTDIYPISVQHYGIGTIVGVNDPNIPGPEFLAYVKITPDIKDSLGRVTQHGNSDLMLFDQNANYLATVSDPRMRDRGMMNGFPIEYNDTSRILLDSLSQDTHVIQDSNGQNIEVKDYLFLDIAGGPRVYLDPRSGMAGAPPYISSCINSTMEFFYTNNNPPDGTQLTVCSEDMDIFNTSPTDWPEYPAQDFSFCSSIEPFNWDGNRYLIFEGVYSGQHSHPEAPRIVWCVKYNEGDDSMDPVWCRYEEDIPHLFTEILMLGPDSHPYMVRFSSIAKKVKVIDLVSGYLMVDTGLDLTDFRQDNPGSYIVIRLNQYNDIPVIIIFDQEAGHIVKIDLKLDG